jgi:tetratricopeptide (TPR) repeat protein
MATSFSCDAATARGAAQEALAAGRFDEASSLFIRSLQSEPDNVYGLCGLSAARFGAGDYGAALEIAKRANVVAPQAIQPVLVLGAPALCVGDEVAVSFCFDVLRKVAKELGWTLVKYWSQHLSERDRFEEAATAFEVFISAHPADYDMVTAFADLLLSASRPAEARKQIERAHAFRPGAAVLHVLGARAHLQLGDIAAAREAALAAIEIDNENLEAHFALADIDPGAMSETMLGRLSRRLGEESLADEVRTLIGSALGRALEAHGDFDEAFEAFSKANACARRANRMRGLVYDRSEAEAAVRAVAERFPKADLAAPAPSPGRGGDLIFIVGLPRSGSTLIDQILSSHSQAASAGESLALPRIMEAILARQLQSGDSIAALIDRHADEWEARYRAGLKFAAGRSQIIIDKSLQNFWHCGLIARLFPAAKIIEMRRDPLDAGLSIYRLLYFGAHTYANELGDIAHYRRCFEAASGYWAGALPRPPYRLVYEDFVADFETQLPALFDYCGLAVEDACREFHKIERPVFTLSAAQVRAGLDRNRSGAWRAYENHLAPLRSALDSISIPVPAAR